MGFKDFMEKWFPVKNRIGPDTVTVDVSPSLYYTELALYTAITLISNAVAQSEIQTFEHGRKVKNEDYYTLNISPNANQSSGEFWRDVIEKMIRRSEGAYVVEYRGKLYCTDSCPLEMEDVIHGNTYTNVSVGNFTFNKRFRANEIFHFKLHDVGIEGLINQVGREYSELMKSITTAVKSSNGKKYRLKIGQYAAGDPEFTEKYENYIQKQLKTYIEEDNAVYPEFEGFELVPDTGTSSGSSNSEEFLKVRQDIFDMVANALHIPTTLMSGNITNLNEVTKVFLTFAVDPIADVIEETLNKRNGYDEWINGNFYNVYTERINHYDIFDVSMHVSNLISSGIFCVDEVREELGREPVNTEWSKQHWMTKNFTKIDNMMTSEEEGGDV